MIFEVTPEHIEKLGDEDLRILIGYLAEQEAVRSGNSAVGVTYGGHQNAADGGIDVAVDLANSIHGYVPRPQTGFQSKAEDMAASDIKKEMRPDGRLRPSIRELGEKNGAYIIVSSKGSVAAPALTKRHNAMAAAIADEPTAAGLQLDFYDRRRLASWVNKHAGLIPWARARVGHPIAGWQPFGDWSSSPEASDADYLADDAARLVDLRNKNKKEDGMQATAGVDRLREILSKPKGVARIVGLSGVGKTRLAQALFDSKVGNNSLSPQLAIYADTSDSLNPTPQELVIHLHSLGQPCVLIIDNCGSELHQKLSVRTRATDSLISLITIEHDISDDEPEYTEVFRLEAASSNIIEKIIKRHYPKLAAPDIRTIAKFSEGNSRVALALASTAEEGISLANMNDDKLFQRLFRQNKTDNPALLKAARALSLVYSFDGETLEGAEAELPALAAIAGQTVEELYGHIEELRDRKLVQHRGKWRALLPHALAHRLAKSYLQAMLPANPTAVEKGFLNDKTPERLKRSFTRRLGHLHDSDRVQELVKRWLVEGGWLRNLSTFDRLHMKAFENVAPVSPEDALKAIVAATNSAPSFSTADNSNRDRVVRLLRSLAYEEDIFSEACSTLASFVDPENEAINRIEALSVYRSLFQLYFSGTLATPQARSKFLRDQFDSADSGFQKLALHGLSAMLGEKGGSPYDFDFGARKRDYGYWPKTRADVRDWYELAFGLAKYIAESGPTNLAEIKTAMASEFAGLARAVGANEKLIELAEFLSDNGGWPEGWSAARAATKHSKESKQAADEKKFRSLADKLKPASLKDRLTSYVLASGSRATDLADLESDNEKKYAKAVAQVATACHGIGQELARSENDLKNLLPLLVESDAQRVWDVGVGMGRSDADPRAVWNAIVAVISKDRFEGQSFRVVSGFILGLSEKKSEVVEELLDAALGIECLHATLVQMHCVTNLGESGVQRLTKAARLTTVPSHTFRYLGMGRCSDSLTGSQFRRLMLEISNTQEGLTNALEIMDMRIFYFRSDKKALSKDDKKVGAELLSRVSFAKANKMDENHLAKIVTACLTTPNNEPVARELSERLQVAITRYDAYAFDYGKLVSALARKFPVTVLDVFVGKAPDGYHGDILRDLRFKRHDPLEDISDEDLLVWAKADTPGRYLQLAESIRPWTKLSKGSALSWTTGAMRLVAEAVDPIPVLERFAKKIRPSTWSGSLADILEQRLSLLQELTTNSNAEIAGWAVKEIATLKEEIEATRKWEQQRDRDYDERFEYDDD